MFNHVLAAVQGAPNVDAWTASLAPFVSARGRVDLLTVLPEVSTCIAVGSRVIAYVDQQEDALRREARLSLDPLAVRLAQDGRTVSIDVRFGDTMTVVLDAARAARVEAIALQSWPRQRVWTRTMTERVLSRAAVPVLLVARAV
jgi:hypothetical protein